MKTCFISGSYPPLPCGIGDYTHRLATTLVQQGTDVEVLTSPGGVREQDSPVRVRPVVHSWTAPTLGLILAQLRAIRPEVVNIQYPTPRYGRHPFINLLPFFIRAILQLPVVTTIHEFTTFRRLGRARVGLSVLSSSRVIVTERQNLSEIGCALPLSRGKLHHVPLGANIEPSLAADFDRLSQRTGYGATESDLVIVYFGFISPSKGVETLLHAFRRLLAEHPECPARLLLVAGREPVEPAYAPLHRQVEALLAEPPLCEHVFWTDYCSIEEVSAYLASADLAVLPFNDGVSLRRGSLLAVLAHGLPVISTPATNYKNELDEENGIFLAPNDEQALSMAMVTLAKDVNRRAKLALQAKKFATTFSWPTIAAQTQHIYQLVSR